MRKLIIMLVFVASAALGDAYAQFNLRPNANNSSMPELPTIRVMGSDSVPTPENLAVFSKAYKENMRKEIFQYRNKVSLSTAVGITQSSFTNWAAGGDNSFSGRAWAKFTHVYTNEESNFNISSAIEGAYTIVVTNEKSSKSEDYLNITSTPSWKLNDRFEASGSLVFRSQFANGYTSDTVLTSTFMTPAYLTLSAGITYLPFKDNCLKIYVAPISGSGTFLLNNELASQGLYGVPAGENSVTQFGMFNRVEFNKKVFKDAMTISSTLESFWDYIKCPNLLWETRVSYNITSLFGVSLYLKAIYDETVATPNVEKNDYWQFNQSLSFNFTFNRASKANGDKPTFLTESMIM